MKILKLFFYFLTFKIKRKTLILITALLFFSLVGSGVGCYYLIRTHQAEIEKKKETQTVDFIAYVDVAKSTQTSLFILDPSSLIETRFDMPEKYFKKVEGLNYPLVRISRTYIGEHEKNINLEVLKKENKEIPLFFVNQDKAFKQIQKRLDEETGKINTELRQLLSQSVETMTFDTNSRKITVKLNPLFAKENDVGQNVILHVISNHLKQINENEVFKTIWEKEDASYPISYTILNEEIAYGDFYEHVTKSNNEYSS